MPLRGLVTMGLTSFNNRPGVAPDNGMEEIATHPAVYHGAVINVTWSQLEPQAGVFDESAIRSALAAIASYNASYPATPVAAKLRVWGGGNAPSWVISASGGPITIEDHGHPVAIGAFWTPTYRAAWQMLQNRLAADFDGGSAIAETTVSSCASLTDEPFIVALDATSLANMRALGFNDAADQECLNGAMADYAAWKKTPIDFPFNTYRDSDGPHLVEDPAFTIGVMQAWRSALGGRAILANHGLQQTLTASANPIYAEFTALGPPLELQGYSPTIDWNASIALGLTYNPTEIEIWQTTAAGGLAPIDQTQLQTWASEF